MWPWRRGKTSPDSKSFRNPVAQDLHHSGPDHLRVSQGVLKKPELTKLQQELESLAQVCNDIREEGSTSSTGNISTQLLIDPSLHVPKQIVLSDKPKCVPSAFTVDANYKCRFISPVMNLDHLERSQLLHSIETVLSHAVRLWEKSLQRPLVDNRLQVVVKAQNYRVLPHQWYEGGVHKEGKNEGIVGVCVFYTRVDSVEGGQLMLGGPSFAIGYTEADERAMHATPVEQNMMVCFDNTKAFHKVGRMTYGPNKTGELKQRNIISLFLIDPDAPVPDTEDLTVNLHFPQNVKRILAQIEETVQVQLPEEICNLITSFVVRNATESDEHLRRIFISKVRVNIEKHDPEPRFVRHACNLD